MQCLDLPAVTVNCAYCHVGKLACLNCKCTALAFMCLMHLSVWRMLCQTAAATAVAAAAEGMHKMPCTTLLIVLRANAACAVLSAG